MDSLALLSLVVCAAVGAVTLYVGWRWLVRSSSQPARREPASAVPAAPKATPPVAAAAPRPAARAALIDDEPTQPMMRTSWNTTGWPSTQPASGFDPAGYAPTQPMPLKPD